MFALSELEETKELVLGWGPGKYTFGPQSNKQKKLWVLLTTFTIENMKDPLLNVSWANVWTTTHTIRSSKTEDWWTLLKLQCKEEKVWQEIKSKTFLPDKRTNLKQYWVALNIVLTFFSTFLKAGWEMLTSVVASLWSSKAQLLLLLKQPCTLSAYRNKSAQGLLQGSGPGNAQKQSTQDRNANSLT